jgi:bacteriorhodopsin
LELFLNIAGALIALAMVCLWLRSTTGTSRDRRIQFVALVVLLLILFPTISMTDDLLAVQNSTETDVYVRLDHLYTSAQSFLPVAITMMVETVDEHRATSLHEAVPGTPPASLMNPPAMAPIENRPPPVA